MKEDSKFIYTDSDAFEDLQIFIKLFYWLNAIIVVIELIPVCAVLFGFDNLINGSSVIILLLFLFIFSLLFLLLITITNRMKFMKIKKFYLIQAITIAPFIWAFCKLINAFSQIKI